MPQETKSHDVRTTDEPTLTGWTVDLTDAEMAFAALEKAFDYRGDITVKTRDGASIEGYIFDRQRGSSLADSNVRLMTKTDDTPVRIGYDRIERLEFSPRDPAAGKSFDNWVKRFVEKKLKGEEASIYGDE